MHAIHATEFETINVAQLTDVNGGFDFTRMVDNGNRYGAAGAALGGGVGTVAGGVVGGVAAGGVSAGVAALPGAAAGAATGAGIGAGVGGALGWLGGAGYDAVQQFRGK